MKATYTPWRGWLHLDGWAGRTKHGVLVVGETPKRYRIMSDEHVDGVHLPGRRRFLPVGETALVPKCAVTKKTEATEVVT